MTPDNPPAFPAPNPNMRENDGPTLLDLYAMAALMGYRAHDPIESSDKIAAWAFVDAADMLKERARVLAERGTE